MSYFEFPYTRSYEGDLGYIIHKLNELNERYNSFFEYNSIRFNDPIDWSITLQYAPWRIVYDTNTETLYISIKPVPVGIEITNTDFWAVVSPFHIDDSFSETSINPVSNRTITNKINLIDTAIDDLNRDLLAEIDNRTNADSALSDRISAETEMRANVDLNLSNRINVLDEDLNAEIERSTSADTLLSARIDEIASLPEGSTSGDAELADIRIGYDGTTYPSAGDAVRAQVSDLHDEVSADYAENSAKINQLFGNWYNVETPDGFTWTNNPIRGKIKTNGNSLFAVDYDISSNMYEGSETRYATLYVDPVNGDDTKNGLTRANAMKTINRAYTRSVVKTIYLCAGLYQRTSAFFGFNIDKSINIIGIDPGVYLTTSSPSTFSLTSGYSYTYSATRSSSPSRVVDIYNTDEKGDPTIYANLSSVDAVEALPGSWYYASGVLYVHTLDNDEPDQTNKIALLTNQNNINVTGDVSFYLENVTVIGGNSPLKCSPTAGTDELKIFAKDCNFYYSDTTNNDVVMLTGSKLSIFENCKAVGGMKDGFNYHASTGIIPKAIEINCTAYDNGNAEDSNDQGSTIHDGGSAIRINGIYYRSYGSNIADQGENTESWNMGCVCYKSLANNNTQNANFFCYNDVNMWLDGCIGFSSVYNINVVEGHNLKVRNFKYTGVLNPDEMGAITYY